MRVTDHSLGPVDTVKELDVDKLWIIKRVSLAHHHLSEVVRVIHLEYAVVEDCWIGLLLLHNFFLEAEFVSLIPSLLQLIVQVAALCWSLRIPESVWLNPSDICKVKDLFEAGRHLVHLSNGIDALDYRSLIVRCPASVKSDSPVVQVSSIIREKLVKTPLGEAFLLIYLEDTEFPRRLGIISGLPYAEKLSLLS